MPRLKKPSNPEVERKIAARFAELRRLWGKSLSEFGNQIELTRGQVSNIERARSPLRYLHATRALAAHGPPADADTPYTAGPFPFNPLWLFGEDSEPRLEWPLLLPHPSAIGLDLNTRFSDFVQDNLPMLKIFASPSPDQARIPASWLWSYRHHYFQYEVRTMWGMTASTHLFNIIHASASNIAHLSPAARTLLRELHAQAGETDLHYRECATRRMQHHQLPEKESSKQLTDAPENVILPPVKSELQDLLRVARRLTKSRGMKTKLARALTVPLPRVSDWLAGKYLPSGQRALALREWVRAEEGLQTKSSGSAQTLPEPKTQSKASNEKKPESGGNKH